LAKTGQQVKFHYQLRVAEGNEEIATSLDQLDPITALLGSDEILPTLEKALLTMKMGENSTFNLEGKSFIEGGSSHDQIKEDTKLILEVELSNI
jgi:FKBP-type peptidyl-prolyl cis-trans isomerase 2